MDKIFIWKVVAATATIIGLIFGFFELYYAPIFISPPRSPDYPDWLKWLRWGITAMAPIVYISLDFYDRFYRKKMVK